MEVTCPGGWVGGWVGGRVGGWPGSDNMTISVQLDLTGTGTGTELGKNVILSERPCKAPTMPKNHRFMLKLA